MQHISQKNKYGCAIACLAIVTQRSYDDILKYFPDIDKRKGIADFHYKSFLFECGFLTQTLHETIGWSQLKRPQWPMEPFAPVHIVSVINEHGPHAIVMTDKGYIFDPNDPKKRSLSEYEKVNGMTGIWRKPIV